MRWLNRISLPLYQPLENRIANQRTDHQWQLAKKLTRMADLIIFEDLNIKGLSARCKPKKDELTGRYIENGQAAKSGLNKAILDASWGKLKQKVRVMSEKAGVIFYEVNPRQKAPGMQLLPLCQPDQS